MKIQELQLLAYGPFTNTVLDFSDGNPGLHIIYGPNEAGKSCILRALLGLLYGIEARTKDSFLHLNKDLRIGARFALMDGKEKYFLRRKGTKNTLLDSAGQTLPDGELAQYLTGISEPVFSSMFGIDHERMIQGGEDLLKAKGDVGESLFSAGLGRSGLRNVLEQLENEADELFTSRGSKKSVNQDIKEFYEAKKSSTQQSLSSREWAQHKKDLVRLKESEEETAIEIRRLAGEKSKLERYELAIPKIARRDRLLVESNELFDVVILPDDFVDNRRNTIQSLRQGQSAQQRAKDAIGRIENDREKIKLPANLLERDGLINDLYQRLGSQRKAATDLPKLEAERDQLLTDASGIISNIYPEAKLEQVESTRPTKQQSARIKDLIRQQPGLAAELTRIDKDRKKQEKELAARKAEMKGLKAARDVTRFRKILGTVQKKGDLDIAFSKSEFAVIQDAETLTIQIEKLGLWSGFLADLERLPVPQRETVDRIDKELSSRATELERIESAILDNQEQIAEDERKIEEMHQHGVVPEEGDLDQARKHRQDGWALVRSAWLDKTEDTNAWQTYDTDHDLPEAYEYSVSRADEIADQLRRDADQVALHATLVKNQTKCRKNLEELERDRGAVQKAIAKLQQEWSDYWQPAGITPLTPVEMRAWLANHDRLVEKAESIRESKAKVEDLRFEIQKCITQLSDVLGGFGEKPPEDAGCLESLIDYCQGYIEKIDGENRRRTTLAENIRSLEADLATNKSTLDDVTRALSTWQEQWGQEVVTLNLEPSVSPVEVEAVLSELDELFGKLAESKKLDKRINGILEDEADFVNDVERLVKEAGPDLADSDPFDAVDRLHVRLTKAGQDKIKLEELDKQLEEQTVLLADAQAIIRVAGEEVKSLCHIAGCQDPDDLEDIERRSLKKKELLNTIDSLEKGLLEHVGGASLDELIKGAGEIDPDQLPAQIQQIDQRLDGLETKHIKQIGDVRSQVDTLNRMDGGSEAAEAAAKAQMALSRIREGAAKYIRVRLASRILHREIENYRKDHQAPVLLRANDYFKRMTKNSFASLKTDYNDQDEPVLVGVRSSGDDVGTDGMSEGTRDQLYLALRLASLSEHLDHNPPLPFVVDDVLINFDDDRARSTLECFAEFAQKTQVLFFTHHSRLVEIARDVGKSGGVFVHTLPYGVV